MAPFREAVDGAGWARSGAVRNKIRVMTADIVDIATDLKALEKKPGAFDPVCLRLRFERTKAWRKARMGWLSNSLLSPLSLFFYLWFVPFIYLELLIALNF
jgi:hypothetical protein